MRWVRLHPYNIAQKVQVVVKHNREMVTPLLGGKARAMVVTPSRVEAVRWPLAINNYIREKGYSFKASVAFSGEVNDKTHGIHGYMGTEHDTRRQSMFLRRVAMPSEGWVKCRSRFPVCVSGDRRRSRITRLWFSANVLVPSHHFGR